MISSVMEIAGIAMSIIIIEKKKNIPLRRS